MMQVFFQMEARNNFDVNTRAEYMENSMLKPQEEYCNEMFSLLCNKREEIDRKLDSCSGSWKLERMPKTDLAILRVAVCEMFFLQNIPKAVSINEAVELAKAYGTEDSSRYVNGILGKLAREGQQSHE